MAMHLQARFTGALDKHQRSLDEIKVCQAEMAALIQDRSSIESRLQEEIQTLTMERDRLHVNNDALRTWGNDLQRGNLELQEYERRYKECTRHIGHMEEENRRLRADKSRMADKLLQREDQLANARKLLRENGFDKHGERPNSVGPGDRRSRKELDDLVRETFVVMSGHEEALTSLVDGVEAAGWKDLTGKFNKLRAQLNQMNSDRDLREREWKKSIGNFYGSQSPMPPPGDDAGADADGEDNGEEDDKRNGNRKGRHSHGGGTWIRG